MIAPTDQQGLEQLRNTSIKLAERWQREAVAKVTPAVKWGTRPGSRSHQTEFFRPMLSVMKAKDLDDAIGIVNSTGFGLTSRLQSLDTREQTHWTERIEAGNLYINRTTTGAIVQRQPFGGLKKSAIGAGTKAGGPNYVLQLLTLEETTPPIDGALDEDSPWLTATQG
jgi:RHH-type proline utilization regulon transcriptional repressor/proline dehydrogenase/delta 1-pyrroline-5-carboxylate dehydrogenase